jgi:hypothetical protein
MGRTTRTVGRAGCGDDFDFLDFAPALSTSLMAADFFLVAMVFPS